MEPEKKKSRTETYFCNSETDNPNFNNSANNHFTFNFDVYPQEDSNCSIDSQALKIETDQENENEQSNTKRKRDYTSSSDDQMPEILNNMEEEIERQLDTKAAKSNLTVSNVKNILKHVITNEQVLQMVKQQMNQDFDVNQWILPQTRSKTKELMKLQPDLWPIQSSKPISKCHFLIDKEFPEDSTDDDEYHPQDDDNEKEYMASEDEKYNSSQEMDKFSVANFPLDEDEDEDGEEEIDEEEEEDDDDDYEEEEEEEEEIDEEEEEDEEDEDDEDQEVVEEEDEENDDDLENVNDDKGLKVMKKYKENDFVEQEHLEKEYRMVEDFLDEDHDDDDEGIKVKNEPEDENENDEQFENDFNEEMTSASEDETQTSKIKEEEEVIDEEEEEVLEEEEDEEEEELESEIKVEEEYDELENEEEKNENEYQETLEKENDKKFSLENKSLHNKKNIVNYKETQLIINDTKEMNRNCHENIKFLDKNGINQDKFEEKKLIKDNNNILMEKNNVEVHTFSDNNNVLEKFKNNLENKEAVNEFSEQNINDAIDNFMKQIKTHENTSDSSSKINSSFLSPGIKISGNKSLDDTISQRTRSKFSLSATPLEDIEKALFPPDITIDMYDLECDDEDWRDFIKEFTEPLPETTQCDDDEHIDPEYNVMAEEEDLDLEELRIDKAVKISKKELHTLIAELDMFSDMYTEKEILDNLDKEKNRQQEEQRNIEEHQESLQEHQQTIKKDNHQPTIKQEPKQTIQERINSQENQIHVDENLPTTINLKIKSQENDQEIFINVKLNNDINIIPNIKKEIIQDEYESPQFISVNSNNNEEEGQNEDEVQLQKDPLAIDDSPIFMPAQILVLEQQLRKHVQLILQHYIQFKYQDSTPDNAQKMKQLLMKLKDRSKSNKMINNILNLNNALTSMDQWDQLVDKNKAQFFKFHKYAKNCDILLKKNKYGRFPKEMMDFVISNNAFIYPLMLPLTQFNDDKKNKINVSESEQHLLALGLEQFLPYLQENSLFKASISIACGYIKHYLMPCRTVENIQTLITRFKSQTSSPLHYYFENNKVPNCQHFVVPIFSLIPPKDQPLQLLPGCWKVYVEQLRIKSKKTTILMKL